MTRIPSRRAADVRRRRRTAARRGRRVSAQRVLRRLAVTAVVLAAALCFPAARRAAGGVLARVERAVEAARAGEARERELRRYARNYGISREVAASVHSAALAEGMDPELAFRLVRVESAFHEQAVSPVGALGLTQLMPATADELHPGITREQILQRETNLRLGFRYFGRLLRYYDGDVDLALHAYNRGLGTVDRIRAVGGDPANGYASKVLGAPGASRVKPAPARVDSVLLHEMAPARLGDGFGR